MPSLEPLSLSSIMCFFHGTIKNGGGIMSVTWFWGIMSVTWFWLRQPETRPAGDALIPSESGAGHAKNGGKVKLKGHDMVCRQASVSKGGTRSMFTSCTFFSRGIKAANMCCIFSLSTSPKLLSRQLVSVEHVVPVDGVHDAQMSAVQRVRVAGPRVRPAVVSNPCAIDALDHSFDFFAHEREEKRSFTIAGRGGRGVGPGRVGACSQ